MADIRDIGFSAAINIFGAILFLLAFAFLRLQPINDRVYFPKWYLKGSRESPSHGGTFVRKFVNLDMRSYLKFLSWMPAALKMPEDELISHAGLDSAVYLRIYLIGLKIFAPMSILAFAVLVPVNWTNDTLQLSTLQHSDIDKLSISNIPIGSKRLAFAKMRLRFLASEKRRPDQFTVLVRNVPPDPDESISELVEHFFLVNHPDHYLTHQAVYNANKLAKLVKEKNKLQNWLDYYQLKFERNTSKRPTTKTGFLGCFGSTVDAIDYYTSEIERVENESLANLEGIEKAAPFLKPLIEIIPKTIGVAIPMKATFFITYIMVDGWAGVAGEILRLKPLVLFHLKNSFLVKTEKDREAAMDPGSIGFDSNEPQIQLYFLLGLVYAVVTPFLLPFILIFFGFAYLVYRHQLLLLGLLSTKGAGQSTPVLLVLPVVTFYFHKYCKNRYEPTFVKCPLQEAMKKDTLERARDPGFDLKGYLMMNAYIHPVFKSDDDDEKFSIADEPEPEVSRGNKAAIQAETPLSLVKYNGSESPFFT
ncbi:hypothetical protein PR202_ga10845 [Eleusine coracana subsp. coracana]|uniref:Calcium permeable stress-gated cation channel 1 n=1 Tax=Eleusine coracana subsp. coracana TaxID=191504 RepID=A0AAV5C7Z8_ELECO|nr:hypothetical protein PR202_ga10845 [Eleusine coracana subsp. coracana]